MFSVIETLRDDRRALLERRDNLLAIVKRDGRDELTEVETAEFQNLTEQIAECRERLTELEADETRSTAAAGAADRAGMSRARVTRQAETYGPDSTHGYFADMTRFRVNGDVDALQRLQRHAQEAEQRIASGEYGPT